MDAGEVLAGKYRVVRALGAGGMGAVFEAVQLDLERRVAVKVLDPELAKDEVLVARLRREARAAAALSHPNVAQVYALHEEEGGPIFVVMELVRGRTLREVLREAEKLEPARVVALGRGLLAGLAAAHAAGIVHRDVKPENAIVVADDRGRESVKLVDFGIARSALPSEAAPLTQEGTTVGTPSYMAPEQVRGEEADARADVWAAGVVLFELATGRRPFRGKDTLETMRAVLTYEPPLLSDEAGAPEALSACVARALRKSPDARFAHAGAMLAALEATATGAPATVKPGRAAEPATVKPGRAKGEAAPARDAREADAVRAGVSERAPPSEATRALPLVRKRPPWLAILLGLGAVGAAVVYALQPPTTATASDAAVLDAIDGDAAVLDASDAGAIDAGAIADAAAPAADAMVAEPEAGALDPATRARLLDCVQDASICFTLVRDDAGRLVTVLGGNDPVIDTCAMGALADASAPDGALCVP